jgi:hypothetical protein
MSNQKVEVRRALIFIRKEEGELRVIHLRMRCLSSSSSF